MRIVRSSVLPAAAVGAFTAALCFAASAAVAAAAPVTARVPASGGPWGTARTVPGLAQLNKGGNANFNAVDCTSKGNCAAGGYYQDGSDHVQAFVISERNGTWGKALEVPGSATLNAGGAAQVYSVSCGSAGNCAAGGFTSAKAGAEAFIVTERTGTWGKGFVVPGSAGLNAGGNAALRSLSCPAAGECAGGGYYVDGSGHVQAFLVRQQHGAWGHAVKVPGSAALNAGGNAEVQSVSCASAGNCVAGGDYLDAARHDQAFLVTEKNGTWGKAFEVPGSGALNKGGIAGVDSVSCPSAGNCAVGGDYADSSHGLQEFVVSQRKGSWGKAIEVPGSGALNAGGGAELHSISCWSAGNCSAGGAYHDGSGNRQVYVAIERNGSWGKAIEVPGTGALNAGGNADLFSLSCSAGGNCAAGGFYSDGSDAFQAFVVTRSGGTWLKAVEVPGSGALNVRGDAQVSAVSCAGTGSCVAAGNYQAATSGLQGFLASKP